MYFKTSNSILGCSKNLKNAKKELQIRWNITVYTPEDEVMTLKNLV